MDNKHERKMRRFGLVGKNISYSFSRNYFFEKFEKEGINDCSYENFDIADISEFPSVIENNKDICGLNVTIPYKEAVIPYLDKLNKKARKIGAVNTIKFTKKGKLIGYNTDYYGFKKSIEPILKSHHKKALILGTGGASKAIAYALRQLNISVNYVSRNDSPIAKFTYQSLIEQVISEHTIIINCTPLGTYPDISDCPEIPYDGISENHILYDLIYNPEETEFLKRGKVKNATTRNGLDMLRLQAEKSWRIWN